jgi:hypothetical protein
MGQWSMTFTREEHLAIGLTYAIVIPAVYIPYILVIKVCRPLKISSSISHFRYFSQILSLRNMIRIESWPILEL